jgi:hypothetical protein
MKKLTKVALILSCSAVPILIVTWSKGLAKTTRGYDVVSWELPFAGLPYMETPRWTWGPVVLIGPLCALVALILWAFIALKSRKIRNLR